MNSPFLLDNILKVIKRIMDSVNTDEKIVIFGDPDVDGLCSSTIMYDYLKNKLNHQSIKLVWNERSKGHGIDLGKDNIPVDTDLLLILDSSSSDVDACQYLSSNMDILIIDHHNPECGNPYATIVNPQNQKSYPNKSSSAGLLVFKVVEAMDLTYKKVDIMEYISLAGMSILSDQMDVTNMENRYFVDQGMKNIKKQIALYALINESRNDPENVDAQVMNFDIIPVLNTVARQDELKKGFQFLLEKDYFKAKHMSKYLIELNKGRKEKVKELTHEYLQIVENRKFSYVISDNSSKGYNGLISSKLADMLKKPSFVLKKNGDLIEGSARSYNDFPLQEFVKDSNLVEKAAGHSQAFGISIHVENWEEFKQYVDDNIDDHLFNPVIEYDLELNEEDFHWDLMDEITEFNKMWGNGSPSVTVKLNKVFVEDRQVFPPKNPTHVKIVTDKFDLLKFNDDEYADDVSSWDNIEIVGQLSINEWNGVRRMQMFIEDYKKLD